MRDPTTLGKAAMPREPEQQQLNEAHGFEVNVGGVVMVVATSRASFDEAAQKAYALIGSGQMQQKLPDEMRDAGVEDLAQMLLSIRRTEPIAR